MKARNKYMLSVPEAGALLGLKRTVAYEAAKRGHLPTITLNNRLYVTVAALEALIGQRIDVDTLNGGTLRAWKMPACTASARKSVLSPTFAVTVALTEASK